MKNIIPFSEKTWVEGAENTEFPIQNLPFGIFSTGRGDFRVGVAIGNYVLDIFRVFQQNHISALPFGAEEYRTHSLNKMMKHGKKACSALRMRLADLLNANQDAIVKSELRSCLIKMSEVQMHLPIEI